MGSFVENNESWTVSHTISLGHNMINNFRFGHLHAIANQVGFPASPADVTTMGITGSYPNLSKFPNNQTYPQINLNAGFATVGSQGNDLTTSDIPMWDFADSFTVIKGKHTIAVGFDYRRWIQKRNLADDFLGDYGYSSNLILSNGSATGFNPSNNPGGNLPANGCTTVTCGTGNSVADFLLGYYNNDATWQPGPNFKPSNPPGNLNQYHFTYFAPTCRTTGKQPTV